MANRETRRASKADPSKLPRFTITVDGVRYPFDMAEMTSEHELDLFNSSKLTIAALMSALEDGNAAPFMAAALVYLARRQAGEKVPYAEIAAAISYSSEIAIDGAPEPDEVGDSPELSAAD